MATQAERSAASRQRLLAAALTLLAEKGVQATSVAEIGARAGMSRAAVNFHFGSKDALLAAVVGKVIEEWEQAVLLPELAAAADFATAMEAALLAHRKMVMEGTVAYRVYYVLLLESLGPSPHLRSEFVRLRRKFRDAFVEGMRRSGVTEDTGVDLEGMAAWFVGALRGIAQQYLLEPDAIDLNAAHAELASAVRARVEAALQP
ncbi:TetR/AcrR family transcriptional regulator [Fodinicola feengrottensis]|uniref:TetR/AcrR family transcriptional regulator n=1 Tax=Fodinicola feengrottensis TaxID=435914 RepID=A0ABP4UPF9_9ACTN|nr:TetR/AcrR family transcriptional regulator [Fodinicola feengrottensis]